MHQMKIQQAFISKTFFNFEICGNFFPEIRTHLFLAKKKFPFRPFFPKSPKSLREGVKSDKEFFFFNLYALIKILGYFWNLQ